MGAKRNDPPRRQRDARKDASVGSIERAADRVFGMPPGSFQLNNPRGRDARSDQKIGTLKKKYERE